MTNEAYEKATMLKNQINSVDKLLDALWRLECQCDPPTRMSSYSLVVDLTETKINIELNQGEVAYIRYSLETYKAVLQNEFGKLCCPDKTA